MQSFFEQTTYSLFLLSSSNAYVSDEIITSRAGVRIRVGNTDAEGRMAMVDVLAHMKEKALEVKPFEQVSQLHTIFLARVDFSTQTRP